MIMLLFLSLFLSFLSLFVFLSFINLFYPFFFFLSPFLLFSILFYFLLNLDEPVWAIGTGLVCPSAVAQEVRSLIWYALSFFNLSLYLPPSLPTFLPYFSFHILPSLLTSSLPTILYFSPASLFFISHSSPGPCLHSFSHRQEIWIRNRQQNNHPIWRLSEAW